MLTNIELQDYLLKNRTKRLFAKVFLTVDFEFNEEKFISIIRNIEENEKDIEVFVFYKTTDTAEKIEKPSDIQISMSQLCQNLIDRTHMDNIHHIEFIVSVPVTEENANLYKSIDSKSMLIINRYEDIVKKESVKKDAYEHDKKDKKKFNLKVVYNKNGCIGSGHCALSNNRDFKIDEDFKAILIDGEEMPGPVKGLYSKIVSTEEPHLLINAAKTCTPRVIAVIDMDTGKRIAP